MRSTPTSATAVPLRSERPKQPEPPPGATSSWEAGLELNLFLDKVRFDFTYYSSTTEDLIFNVPVSAASGYSSPS